jgi:hypothetical protein
MIFPDALAISKHSMGERWSLLIPSVHEAIYPTKIANECPIAQAPLQSYENLVASG